MRKMEKLNVWLLKRNKNKPRPYGRGFIYAMNFLTHLIIVGTAAPHTQSTPTAITHSWAASAIPTALIPPITARKLPKK